MKKLLLALAITVVAVIQPALAYDFSAVSPSGQTLYYNIVGDNTVEVTSQNSNSPYYLNGGPAGTLTIPSSVIHPNTGITYNVISIGTDALRNCDYLTFVTIPNSVTSIEYGAFYNCDRLSNIDFGDSVISIGGSVFYRCYSLADIVFPESLRTIGGEAFRHSNITSVTFPTALITVDETAFWECPNFSKAYFLDSLPPYDNNFFTGFHASIYVPCQYVSNYQNAFFGDSYILSRIHGKNYDWESSYNFVLNDSTLGSISYEEMDCDSNIVVTVNAFDGYQFLGWSDGGTGNPRTFHLVGDTMVTAIMGDGNPYFSAVAPTGQTLYYRITDFNNNTAEVIPQNLEFPYYTNGGPIGALTIPSLATNPNTGVAYNVVRINNNAFQDCYSLTSVNIPNSVTSIGYSAFYNCRSLVSANIPNSVTTIENETFNECSNLASVNIPNSVTTIRDWAFHNCDNLSSITIPNSVTYIGDAAFNNCDALTSMIIPNSVTYIGNYVFQNCSSLITITLPDSITSIGSALFSDCSSLTSITIPNSVRIINNHAFYECNNLTSVIIPNSVTHIRDNAFDNCDSLTSITIPNSVTYVGNYAFINCHNLTTVSISNAINSIESYTFANCYNLTSITIPESVTSIRTGAFQECINLTSINIPNSVTYIGNNIFSGCWNQSKIYFNDTVAPRIENTTFDNCNVNIYVPCEYLNNYQNATHWSNYSSLIRGMLENWEHSYNFVVNDSTLGSISFTEVDCDSNVVVTVNANEGYIHVGWSDGGTGNPRTFHITRDTMVTAIIGSPYFSAVAPTGQTLYYRIIDNTNNVEVVSQNTEAPYYSDGGPVGTLVIPDTVTNPNTGFTYNVVTIGYRAFKDCYRLTSVTLPNSLISIGESAFENCINISNVEFGNSLITIGLWNFVGCSNLSGDIILPESVRTIGPGAFQATNISSITIQNSLVYIESNAFPDCPNPKIYITDTFPPSIAHDAFGYCGENFFYVPCQYLSKYDTALIWNNLSSQIYGMVENWEHSYNFLVNDSTLGSVTFTEVDCDSNIVVTVNAFDGYQFLGWSDGGTGNPRTFHLVGDTMVTAIIGDPFFSAVTPSGQTLNYRIIENTNNVEIVSQNPSGNSDGGPSGDLIIHDSVVNPNTGITYIVVRTESYAFANCDNLISVVFPNSLTSVGYATFDFCDQISRVELGNSVTLIDDWSFSNCWNLSKIYLNSINPPEIKDLTLESSNAIIYVPCQSVSNYQNATRWSNYLSRIYGKIENWEHSYNFVVNDSTLGSISFTEVDCDSNVVVTVNANEGYRLVGWSDGGTGNPRTFHLTGDTMVTAIIGTTYFSAVAPTGQTLNYMIDDAIYSNNVTLTGYVFEGRSIGELIIPDSVINPNTGISYNVITIAGQSFRACNSLTSVTIPNSVTTIGGGAFQECSNLTSLSIGNSVSEIQGYAFRDCGLISITIPDNVTTIGDEVFFQCYNLNTVYLTGVIPPSINQQTFQPDVNYYVPCLSVNDYQSAYFWSNLSSHIYGKNYWKHSYNFIVNDSIFGSATFSEVDCDSNIVVTVNENVGYRLIGWSDGGMGNPRTFHLVGDTMVTAILDYIPYSVTVQPNDTLRGIVMGNDTVHYGDTVVIAATANYGYHFSRWNDGNTNNPRYVTITQDMNFTAIFDKNNYNIALSADSNIHGYMTGMGDYEYLDNRTISAIANHGYHFTHWNDGDTNNPRIITLTQDTAFTAYFAKNIYSTIVQSSDTVRGSATGDTVTEYLSPVIISATANYGYHFSQWNDGNTNNPRTVTVTNDTTYVAVFDKNIYNIDFLDTNINGYIMGLGNYEYLDTCSITAIANYGYHFTHWNDGDTNNPRIITLTQDTAFTAYFTKNTYTLLVQSNDTTLGEVSGSTVCEYLDTISISATAIMPHYHFVQWSDGNTNATRNIVVTADSVIMAIFAIDTHSVTLATNNDSYGSANGTCNVPYGTTVTIEATASDGYHFAEWSNGNRNNPDNITIVSDTVITAIFTDDVIPQICMVSVQNGYNTVIWEKGLKVASYNIYREGNTANQYELVSTVSYDSLSTWVDSTSNPRSRSYRYRMTATDIYGYESEAGDVHKTMHLTINKGIGNQWNLVWTEYEGAPYTTYVIYRGTNASNIQQIDVMPAGGNTTYTDENAQEGDVYYQVGVMMSSPCNPSKSSSIIMSNIATNGNVGIQNIDLTDVNIFSRMGEIIVENSSGKPIQVLDVLGRTIYLSNNISYNDCQVTISVPKSGVYLVKVGDCPTKKVVVVK